MSDLALFLYLFFFFFSLVLAPQLAVHVVCSHDPLSHAMVL